MVVAFSGTLRHGPELLGKLLLCWVYSFSGLASAACHIIALGLHIAQNMALKRAYWPGACCNSTPWAFCVTYHIVYNDEHTHSEVNPRIDWIEKGLA